MEALQEASHLDTDDCAKKLLCELARKSRYDGRQPPIDAFRGIANQAFGGGGDVITVFFMYTQCVFIFVVSGLPSFQSDLEWDEELLLHFYGKPLEYTAEGELSLFFNLAVKVKTGPCS